MKRLLFVTTLTLALVFCLGQSAVSAEFVFKFATVVPPSSPSVLEMVKFSEIVAEKSKGRIKVDVFPAAQLGGEKELVEGVSLGTLDMFQVSPGSISGAIPQIGVLDCPYLFRDLKHLQKVVRGDVGMRLSKIASEKRGIKFLALDWYFGTRHLTTKTRKVENPSDMKGLLIRVQPDKLYMEMIKAMGGTPTPVAFSELYMALKQGTVEGQENPIPTIHSAKFYEAQKYLNLTGHMIRMMAIGINERNFNKLPADLQTVMLQATKEAGEYGDNILFKQEKELIDDLKAKGMVVVQPQIEEFRKACSVIPAMFEKDWGKDNIQTIRQIQ